MDRLSAAELLLLAQARDIQEAAYAPYSKFRVGAAVFTAQGDIFRESTSRTRRTARHCVPSETHWPTRSRTGSPTSRRSLS